MRHGRAPGPVPTTRRRGPTLLVALLAACAVALAACGGGDDAAEAGGGGEGFPRTVAGALGDAAIPERPARVVALGSSDADVAVALGVVPVAIPKSFGTPVQPWLAQRLPADGPEVLHVANGVPFERVAALRPDVILAMTLDGVADHYDTLGRIAPTVAYVAGPYRDSWQEQVRVIGRALGRGARAEELVADLDARLDATVAQHPELAGRTVSFSNHYEPGKIVTVQSPDDPAMRFITRLGLVRAPGVAALPTGQFGNSEISMERLDVLDADVVVMLYGSPTLRRQLEGNPLFRRLSAVRRGDYVVVDLDTAIAMRTPSVLSIPWGLDRVVPELSRALR